MLTLWACATCVPLVTIHHMATKILAIKSMMDQKIPYGLQLDLLVSMSGLGPTQFHVPSIPKILQHTLPFKQFDAEQAPNGNTLRI